MEMSHHAVQPVNCTASMPGTACQGNLCCFGRIQDAPVQRENPKHAADHFYPFYSDSNHTSHNYIVQQIM